MELEELMTNRVLLEKMSDTDIHTPLRKPPKHVVIQEHHSKPKEIRIEYKDVHNNISYTAETNALTPPPPPPPIIMDGYGCKCPDKLKRVIKILWIVFILLYIFGMPIILIHMHTKLVETEQRLNTLEMKLNNHLSSNHKEGAQVEALREGGNNVVENDKKRMSPSQGMDDYVEKNYEWVLKSFKSIIEQHEQRLNLIKKFRSWLNETNVNGTNSKGNHCICLTQFFDVNKEEIAKKTKGDCECKETMIGERGPQGPPGPKGTPGSDATVDEETLESLKGTIGKRGPIGIPGMTGPPGPPGVDGTCDKQCIQSVSTTYTRWGRSSCPKENNATTVYKGYIGGSHHMHVGGGSNYLCLPENPKYDKIDVIDNAGNRAFIYGTEYELGDSNIFDRSVKTGTYFDAVCSVCQIQEKNNAIMIPGTTVCPSGWRSEYHGYIMAQKRYTKRTEYICVDHKPDLDPSTKNWGKGAFLHFVETRCGALPCRTGKGNHYKEHLELSCVVCST